MTPTAHHTRCKRSGCKEHALSRSDACWDHLDNQQEYISSIISYASGNPDLRGFCLKKVSLKGASLSGVDLSDADLSQADLSHASLNDAHFQRTLLVGATAAHADLTNADFSGSDGTKVDFSNARLWHADFTNANLNESDLSDADLWNATFCRVKFWNANLKGAKFLTRRSFAGATEKNRHFEDARIDESGLISAEESYRNIKNYFLARGMYNDASWASCKEKAMERFILKKDRRIGYIPSLVMNLLCGYGERPSRIVASSLMTIFIYAFLYTSLGSLQSIAFPGERLSFADSLYCSTITFTTVGYGDLIPKPFAPFRLLAASEAFIGAFLVGLFIFTLARRYSAR